MPSRPTLAARLWRALLFWLLCLPCVGTQAQSPDDERARVHFVAGNSYFESGRWDEAAREFEQAYQLSGRPEMLINLSRAHERGEHLREAIADLSLLLERYPLTVYKPEAERRISEMRLRLGDEPTPPTPAQGAQGETQTTEAAPAERAPAEEDMKVWPPRLPTLLIGGAAAATGVASLVTGLLAHARYKDLEKQCPSGDCAPRFAGDRTRGQRLARSSTALSFVALTLTAATGVLWYLDVRKKRDTRSTNLDLSVGATHAEARLRLDF